MKKHWLLFLILSIVSCGKENNMNDQQDAPNILLIITDDMGKDATNGFTEGSIKPNTPNIDALRSNGLSFENFWVYPTCTPTRASIITGKYGYRTNVKWANDELSAEERTLQQYINEKTNDKYATAIIGKWHLSGDNAEASPESYGVGYYAGLLRGAVQNYYQWQLTKDGANMLSTEYTTTEFTNLAIDWVKDQSKPWFLWLAYNAPHTPFHVPPQEMHSQGSLPEYNVMSDPMPYYMAAIEAIDYQLGRLFSSLDPEELENTIIIFLGDNGTPNQVAQTPYTSNTVKGTLYQGGINVPLYVSGNLVTRKGTDQNLLSSTDLFSTIAELAGVQTGDINDSNSFVKLLQGESTIRDFQYAEMNDGTKDLWTISNGEYKLIVNKNGEKEMFDLTNDPYEYNELISQGLTIDLENIKLSLEEALDEIRN